ncbi:MAG: hypothetical protein IK105_06165 [Thermoguttaceae bacterium]|nr:hypothetical protein [Thermoguttaceae bacterium]
MDSYKKIFRSYRFRQALLRSLGFIPDRAMTSLQYYVKLHRRIDWKNPRRYTEKVQVYKTYYRDPLMVTCSDKADVRGYVAQRGLSEILNEVYAVCDSYGEVDFGALPRRFVAKDTLGDGAGHAVILCADKDRLDRAGFEKQLRGWVAAPHRRPFGGREWPYYSGKKHRILIEKYLDAGPGGLTDYKFFCFDGEPKYLYVMTGRGDEEGPRLGIFDAGFNKLPCVRRGRRDLAEPIEKPENYGAMLEAARRLSAPFPHVRVDLYNIGGKIVFGELTFFSGTGYIAFDPDSFDYTLGEAFRLPESILHRG